MPIKPDDQQRIDVLRAELLDIGLDWNTHYRLVDEGKEWVIDYMCMITPEQYYRAQVVLALIMNS